MIGGGYIAMGFPHVCHAFGVHVTVLEAERRLLTSHDAEVAEALRDHGQARDRRRDRGSGEGDRGRARRPGSSPTLAA
jgi:pyruvate/2-oxoglutarate dehydrogenase complex dihydrolipoamide dehydrogenase (E3) component